MPCGPIIIHSTSLENFPFSVYVPTPAQLRAVDQFHGGAVGGGGFESVPQYMYMYNGFHENSVIFTIAQNDNTGFCMRWYRYYDWRMSEITNLPAASLLIDFEQLSLSLL